jgi:hypothetical protein
MNYLSRLEEKIWRCLRYLANREFEKARNEDPHVSPLEEAHANDASVEDFVSSLCKLTERDDIESATHAVGEIDWETAVVRECQLLLLAVFLDLETRDVKSLSDHIRNIARHGSRLVEDRPDQFDRLCGAVLELAEEDYWRLEIITRAATRHLNAGDLASARRWLKLAPSSEPGVFRAKLNYLRRASALADNP